MGKLIFLVLAIIVVWLVLKNIAKARRRDQASPSPAAEDMVQCTHCGVHLPRSESHASGANFFCSEDHLRLHK